MKNRQNIEKNMMGNTGNEGGSFISSALPNLFPRKETFRPTSHMT